MNPTLVVLFVKFIGCTLRYRFRKACGFTLNSGGGSGILSCPRSILVCSKGKSIHTACKQRSALQIYYLSMKDNMSLVFLIKIA